MLPYKSRPEPFLEAAEQNKQHLGGLEDLFYLEDSEKIINLLKDGEKLNFLQDLKQKEVIFIANVLVDNLELALGSGLLPIILKCLFLIDDKRDLKALISKVGVVVHKEAFKAEIIRILASVADRIQVDVKFLQNVFVSDETSVTWLMDLALKISSRDRCSDEESKFLQRFLDSGMLDTPQKLVLFFNFISRKPQRLQKSQNMRIFDEIVEFAVSTGQHLDVILNTCSSLDESTIDYAIEDHRVIASAIYSVKAVGNMSLAKSGMSFVYRVFQLRPLMARLLFMTKEFHILDSVFFFCTESEFEMVYTAGMVLNIASQTFPSDFLSIIIDTKLSPNAVNAYMNLLGVEYEDLTNLALQSLQTMSQCEGFLTVFNDKDLYETLHHMNSEDGELFENIQCLSAIFDHLLNE